jgi:ribosomal protein L19
VHYDQHEEERRESETMSCDFLWSCTVPLRVWILSPERERVNLFMGIFLWLARNRFQKIIIIEKKKK